MLILRAKIALNALICMILFIFSLIIESGLLRNVGFYRSFLQFETPWVMVYNNVVEVPF